MEQKFAEYIQNLVNECMQSPKLAALPDDQKKATEDRLKMHLNMTIMNTMLDYLNEDQLKEFNTLDLEKPEAMTKIGEMAATVPNFLEEAQTRVLKDVETIKQTGVIPQQ